MSYGSTTASAAPRVRHFSATHSRREAEEEVNISFAPSAAYLYAHASPIPDDAPVIQTAVMSYFMSAMFGISLSNSPRSSLSLMSRNAARVLSTSSMLCAAADLENSDKTILA